jgi:fatty-acyl-CoA synthase
VFAGAFAPTLAEVLPRLPRLRVLIQVEDGSGNDLLPGAVEYEAALAAASAGSPPVTPSPDDLYILYTGGTTGMPKGVLWRQADIFPAALGGVDAATGGEWGSYEAIGAGAAASGGMVFLPAAPFMHGAGHWIALSGWHRGNPVAIQSVVDRLDADDVWSTVERERVGFLQIVGDAFARPLLQQLEAAGREGRAYDLSSLGVILSGGAALSVAAKEELLEHLPHVMVVDGVGSSEAGGQMSHGLHQGQRRLHRQLRPRRRKRGARRGAHHGAGARPRGHGVAGQGGPHPPRLPGGPGEDGAHLPHRRGRAVLGARRPGPPARRRRHRAARPGLGDHQLGRREDLRRGGGGGGDAPPDVHDAVVCGRPSEQWGQEVVALVRLREGATAGVDEIRAVAGEHLARYKVPKVVVFLEEIVRSPAGKADYRWARATAEAHAG